VYVSRSNFLFTSESVSEGHPDKVADQISDAVLDAFIERDIKLGIADDSQINTRLGCETLCTTNKIVVAGEGRGQLFRTINGVSVVDRELITEIARGVVKDIGYDQNGFSYHGADVEVLLHGQSPDIAMGVNAKKKKGKEEEGAGDQGMMFGYACTESEVYEKGTYMPAPIFFAHRILKVLSEKRRSGQFFDLQPDTKSQVTVQYVNNKPVGCTKVVVSTQHNEKNRNGKKYTPGMVKDLIGNAVESALPKGWMPKKSSDFLVNPTGNFVVGGPDGDCGLTGRKIIVDTYGGYAPHGGGAFSGKDPTKVDRSAAYAARYLAKNVVAAGLATQCTIQIAYAIGVADPMSVLVDTHGTSKIDERKLAKVLPEIFRLTPTNIRRSLKLNRPIYRRTAAYGHFGRAPEKDGGFSWEQTNLVNELKSAFK
jgi:S-adenosylmethionine synthetase